VNGDPAVVAIAAIVAVGVLRSRAAIKEASF
jgi:hypothetical protein